jgi:DeoR/GlpR family transcriptional regulator of sugar metabolism
VNGDPLGHAVSRLPEASGETSKDRRQRLIAERVVAHGSCVPQDLATEFEVSIMTIHRDLDALERRGLVRKFHGGVTAQPSGVFESQLSYRMVSRTDEKKAVARVALRFVEPGMSLLIDDSTTTLQMVPGLAERTPLHVATTFLPALHQLATIAEDHELKIVGLGGLYDIPHESFVGMQCIEQIEGIRADALFMSTSAVSTAEAFHQEERIVALKRAMVKAATRKYLLVDHSKLGRVALHRIVPLDVFDLVITDSGADPDVLAAWKAAGIRYEVAP